MACLDVSGRRCVVVGGGSVGFEKAAGPRCVRRARDGDLARVLHEAFAELDVEWVERRYRSGDLDGAFLVIAATSDPEGQ